MIPDTLKHLAVPIDSLRPHPRNARVHDDQAIKESLRAHGQFRPIVVWQGQNVILAGNGTYANMLELGAREIAATFVDVDEDEATRILLVDNRASELAGYDEGLLLDLIQSLPDLSGTGYSQQALDDLVASVNAAAHMPLEETGDPDSVPEPPVEPTTKRGDIIVLGRHRLLCGDSTFIDDVQRVMGEQQADMVWTDPPYGVSYEGVWHGEDHKRMAIHNDALDEDELERFLRDALTNAYTVSRAGAVWYVAAPAGPLHLRFAKVLHELGVWRQTLQWVKNHFVMGRSDYHYRNEPIFYGWRPDGSHYFVDDRTQDSLWEIDRPQRNAEHPTMKPVELVARAIRNSSKKGDVVLDVFGGSGTTLIACEQERRKGRLIELSPQYCDVIVRRWEIFTGKTATRLTSDERDTH